MYRSSEHHTTINATAVIVAASTPPPQYDELDFTSSGPTISITINTNSVEEDLNESEPPPPSYEDLFEVAGDGTMESGGRQNTNEGNDTRSISNNFEHIASDRDGDENGGNGLRPVGDEH